MRWIKDEEGDIGLTFWNIITLVKYKDSIIIKWFIEYEPADKYQGSNPVA